jgi:hypothetical protein
MHIADV